MCDELEIKNIIYKKTHKNTGACVRNNDQLELETIASNLEDEILKYNRLYFKKDTSSEEDKEEDEEGQAINGPEKIQKVKPPDYIDGIELAYVTFKST